MVFVFRSEAFTRFGLQFYAYMCIEFQEVVTDASYIYYKKSGNYLYSLGLLSLPVI